MDPYRINFVRRAARDLIDRLWDHRATIWELPPSDRVHMVPIPVERVARDLLSIDMREVAELQPLDDGSTVAGVWDPTKRLIEIARGFKPHVKRFTAAHEVGHYVLHPSMSELHRTSPLESQETVRGFRFPQEREANLFAGELLVSVPLLEEIFRFMYGSPIFPSTISDDLLEALGVTTKRSMTLRGFAQMSPHQRAHLIAGNSFVLGIPARSLAEIFGVSVTTLAIQLEDLGLVN